MIPLRQPGRIHHPPQLALWCGRTIERRRDLPGAPAQVSDRFVMDDDDSLRALDSVQLVNGTPPQVPAYLTYGFPYARSSRAQIAWKRAQITVRYVH